MDIECGDCNDFVELTERQFGGILDHHGFRPIRCTSEHDGRECILLFESRNNRLLFVRSDGADSCALGSLDAEFPESGIHGQGENGWYHVVALLEFRSGKKLLTRRRLNKFLEGKDDYFLWQANLLADNADELFGLFSSGNEATWRNGFMQYYRALIKG